MTRVESSSANSKKTHKNSTVKARQSSCTNSLAIMSDNTDNTWITEYLKDNPTFVSADLLEGGVSNFVYRLTKTDGSTVILKHAEPYAAFDKTWSYGIQRIKCEAAALSSIYAALPPSDCGAVETPRVISYNDTQHNLIINDFGPASKDLHTAFPSLTPKQREDYGRRLGKWLAALHQCNTIDTAAFASNIEAKERKGMDQRISLLSAGLPSANSDTASPEQVAVEKQEFNDLLEDFVVAVTGAEAGCVVHGDFWPGNILVSTAPVEDRTEELIAVIDLEGVGLGTGATDAGIFAAEAWLLSHFHSSSAQAAVAENEDFGMLNSFLASYLEAKGSVSEAFLKEAILQFAINLSVGRGGKILMLPVKQFGVQIVKLVMEQEIDWKGLLELDWGMYGWKAWIRNLQTQPAESNV